MRPIARARAAGVLLTLVILLIPSSPDSGPALSDLVASDSHAATAPALAVPSGHRPDATGTHPAAGQLAPLPAHLATTAVDRRADRDGQFHGGPAALACALLAAALLFGVGRAGRARRGGRPVGDGRGPRSPPRLQPA